jgi:hypothetical protein
LSATEARHNLADYERFHFRFNASEGEDGDQFDDSVDDPFHSIEEGYLKPQVETKTNRDSSPQEQFTDAGLEDEVNDLLGRLKRFHGDGKCCTLVWFPLELCIQNHPYLSVQYFIRGQQQLFNLWYW